MRWLPIPSTQGMYEVSDAGTVRSWRNNRHPIPLKTPRILKPSTMPKGHLQVAIYGVTRLVHHLVLEAFVGARPIGMETRHLNGIPSDNNLTNLVYGTPKQNQADRLSHGTSNRGRGRKLTATSVLAIRQRLRNGESQGSLSADFGVSQTTISEVGSGRKWAWLAEQGL